MKKRSHTKYKGLVIEYIMQAWVQAERFSNALPWAEKWFRAASPKERKHYDLLNFLYNNLGMPGKQADIVKQMINRWPEDKSLWDAWASMLANGGREQEAFEVTKMLYLGGALNTEQDLMKVVQYYSFYDMPYQAAEILEREMNAGRIAKDTDKMVQLSNLFRQAREYKRAIPVLEQAAAGSGQATCSMSTEQKDAAPISQTRRAAVEAFRQVPATSRENRNAKKWVSFIAAERNALDRRCEFEKNIERELCYQKIKGAYDNEIFEGKFLLEDKNCEKFKEDYDAAYVVRTTG